MDRIISEEKWEHISKLSEIRSKYSCFEDDEEPYYRALSEGIKALKAIPSAEPKWISTSERLPKEGEDVLACFYTSEGNYKMMVSRRSDYNYWSGVGRTGDMVAWQPLPKPYEPQEISDRNLKMWEEIYEEEKRRERSE